MKDLINQINLTLQKINPEENNNENNNLKIRKRVPKIWRIQKPIKKETNTIKKNKSDNLTNQKLKNKELCTTINNDINNHLIKNKSNYKKENKNAKEHNNSVNKKKDDSTITDKDPLVFKITNQKSLYSKKERPYKIDFDKFYSLIERTKDILGTLNKYEKVQHDQHYQIIYKMCK